MTGAAQTQVRAAPASYLVVNTGSWAHQLAVSTRSCARYPLRWQCGQPAHATTYRVYVRIGGLRWPPAVRRFPVADPASALVGARG